MSTPNAELKLAPPTKVPSRVLLYGVEGIGKSTLASKFPAPLFLDIENSTVKMNPRPACMPEVFGYQQLKNQINDIYNAPHQFKTLVIDSVSVLEELIEDDIVANPPAVEGMSLSKNITSIESFGYGKGYKIVEEEFCRFLDGLGKLMKKRQMHIVLIAHSIVNKAIEPGTVITYDRFEINLSKKLALLVKQWPDAVLFANYNTMPVIDESGKTRAIGGKERLIYCNHTAVIDAKNRFGLPDSVPMTIESLKPIFE